MTPMTAFPVSCKRGVEFLLRNAAVAGLCRWGMPIATSFAAIILAITAPRAIATAGDAYVYRVVNAYNNETVGHVRQELTPATTAQGQVMSITVDNPALGLPRTEIHTADGQWLRRPLDNHGMAVEYEFGAALPALQPPLT
ncbi:MAG TPA: hypothetical protein VK642_04205, partial [Burkholderiales bacterium]|nr:hypothetical protein [Burkholderiales bacterium]